MTIVADATLPAGTGVPPTVSWMQVLKIWWLMTWRATLGGALTGLVIGLFAGIVAAMLGWPPVTRTIVFVLLGGAASVVWRVVAVRMALTKRYSPA
ncbi:MAG TPA: hypothetical protein VMB84_15080 [Stellaceae bacterium]|nr:hypothetical protein [Stellaceae bacterium]